MNFSLKAGATKSDSMPIRCATGAAAVETEWYWVSFGDGTKWENPSQPPDQRAKGVKSCASRVQKGRDHTTRGPGPTATPDRPGPSAEKIS